MPQRRSTTPGVQVVGGMGTSTRQRSPRTQEWDRVHRLYDDPGVPPEVIVSHIVDALTPETRAGMAGPPVTRCMATLVGAGAGLVPLGRLSIDPSLPAALDLAAALRLSARRDIAQARAASRFGEIGLDALTAATLDVTQNAADLGAEPRALLARYAEERRLSELARAFLSQDTAAAFRYFVERDTPEHVGGPRLHVPADASRLADRIAQVCLQRAYALDLAGAEDDLRSAAAEGDVRDHRLYRRVLANGLSESLRALEGDR